MCTDAISPLRHRMIEDMNARKLGRHSQRSHIHSCKRFAAHLRRSPDTATPDDVRRFQLHLIESGLSICNRNRIMTGVRFLFRVTLRRLDLAAEIYHIKEPQKIPLVMSPDETWRLLVVARTLKVRVLLALGYGAGLRASEVVRLRVGDIDSAQGIIRVVQAKGRKDRNVMLSPEVLALLRHLSWEPTSPGTRLGAFFTLCAGRKKSGPVVNEELLRRGRHSSRDLATSSQRVAGGSGDNFRGTSALALGADISLGSDLPNSEQYQVEIALVPTDSSRPPSWRSDVTPVGEASRAKLARDLERAGLPGVPRRAAIGCAAQVVRQLRPALEPLTMSGDGARTSPSPHRSSRWGEGRREGRQQTPEQTSAPHPNPLPASPRVSDRDTRPSTSSPRASGEREHVSVIIPCLDEEEAIGPCVTGVLAQGVGEVIVVDGQSSDRTAEHAAAAGAKVVVEARRGYGRAMQAGLAAMSPASTIVLFIDGDGSDRPELVPSVLEPIEAGRADFVLGSRLRGDREPGSLARAQIVAGRLAGLLIRLLYGARFTDMSPFRAIRRDALDRLGMGEESFGWNLEMQMRVAAAGLRVVEVPVGQRRRAGGISKVSGSWLTAVRAGWALAATFCRLAIGLRRAERPSS